jgi:hypothetical protein
MTSELKFSWVEEVGKVGTFKPTRMVKIMSPLSNNCSI